MELLVRLSLFGKMKRESPQLMWRRGMSRRTTCKHWVSRADGAKPTSTKRALVGGKALASMSFANAIVTNNKKTAAPSRRQIRGKKRGTLLSQGHRASFY
jgi:hypothetical protein